MAASLCGKGYVIMKKNKMSVGFLAPAFIIYTALLVIPILMAFYFSLFKWNGFNTMEFL